MSGPRRTPLHDAHVRLGARMVEFAGFSMPVQYTSIVEEHRAVREAAGLFDVSHMGQIHLSGPEALASGDRLLSRRVSTQREGRVRYALLCNESGGGVDAVTACRAGADNIVSRCTSRTCALRRGLHPTGSSMWAPTFCVRWS